MFLFAFPLPISECYITYLWQWLLSLALFLFASPLLFSPHYALLFLVPFVVR